MTIACTTKEFYTEKWHSPVIDAPGHRDFIKNMISGAAQADVALVMVPADGNFVTAIQRGNHKAGEIQGQTRQHSRLINLLGVKQLIIGVNKMDCDTAGYKKDRYDEISAEMINMLQKVGEFRINESVASPVCADISGMFHSCECIIQNFNFRGFTGAASYPNASNTISARFRASKTCTCRANRASGRLEEGLRAQEHTGPPDLWVGW